MSELNHSQTKFYRNAEIVLDTFNEESRTFEISFSSETPVLRDDGLYEVLDHSPNSVDLSLLNQNGKVFADHKTDVRNHIGNIDSAWLVTEEKIGRAKITLGDSTTAKDIISNIRANTPPGISIGYTLNPKKIVKESESVYRVMQWAPYEISAVGIPADYNVGFFRSLINTKNSEEVLENISNDVNQSASALENVKEDEKTTINNSNLRSQKMENTENKEVIVDVAAQIATERKRVATITSLSDEFSHISEVRSLATKAIADGKDISTFQAEILARMKTAPAQINFGQGAKVEANAETDKKRGFKNFTEFVSTVRSYSIGAGVSQEIQTRAAPSVFANVSNGADGGFAIPPEFATQIADFGSTEDSLLPLTTNLSVSGNSMRIPFNATQPWASGIQAYWRDEAATATQTKHALDNVQLNLHSLMAFCPATDELLSDSPAMAQFILTGMNRAVNYKINDAIINGLGTTQPLGILQSGGLVSVAKEGSQAADTVVAANVAKMLSRVIQGQGSNLVWIIHPDVFPQLVTMTLGDQPIWTNSFKELPNGALLGKPILLSDTCATVGDVGDIILANMNGYYAITKQNGIEFAESMHLWFDQGLNAFRLTFRMDGRPALAAPISPAKGSNTRGHFVTLAARA